MALVLLAASIASPGYVASMGASATLILGAPDSPLGRADRALVGNVGSALVGLLVGLALGPSSIAVVLAVALSLAFMSACDAMHPPGGATAMIAAMGGSAIEEAGLLWALHPIGTTTGVLLGLRRLLGAHSS